jgi:hypothetical protein
MPLSVAVKKISFAANPLTLQVQTTWLMFCLWLVMRDLGKPAANTC